MVMDALASLLEGPRAKGAFIQRAIMDPPWSIRVQDRAPLCLVALTRGAAWAIPERGEATRMRPGDVAIMRGPEPYTFADDPGTPSHVVVQPGDIATTADGEVLCEIYDLGVRTWGNSLDGSTAMIIGTYHMTNELSRRLLTALPPMLVLPADAWNSPLIPLLGDEIVKDEPAQEVMLDRLLDLLLIGALRAWFSHPEAKAPQWYRAYGDPVVGRALRILHRDPAQPWTVAKLATETGVSRAALARRFTELVGKPPMAYLAGWRLALAADLLREPDATVGSVARQVGYGSPFALSAAFKREHGVSPQQYRTGAFA